MADHLTIARLDEQRSLPERLRQRVKADRGEEALGDLRHFLRANLALLENRLQRYAAASTARPHELKDVVPFLRPDISEQIGRNWTVRRHDVAVFIPQPRPHVCVQ